MIWSAVVPLKAPGQRKSRLAERLSVEERDVLAERVAGHVGLCLSGEPRISRIIQLSVARSGGWRYQWRRDEGRGLNVELNALRANSPTHGLLVIHGDLPVLRSADIAAMLDAAEANDIALARTGTSAGRTRSRSQRRRASDFRSVRTVSIGTSRKREAGRRWCAGAASPLI